MSAEINTEKILFVGKSVCSKCDFLVFGGEICGGEVLPIQEAIARNLEGRGQCSAVKDFIAELAGEEQKNEP